ncbi:carbohydrate-binding module family 50 protein [Sodiomyces alcalophilus JCM 7366]|uniref:carbohydrate-binding module family 50 protein n=1 Tax=Sodiomyces alcalophilus JCM 7366 TaxID=591952 RepID=UPI0039B4D104
MIFSARLALPALWASSAVAQWLTDPPSIADPNTPADCSWWHIAASSDTCESISLNHHISEAQFQSYNPTLASACDLVVGNSYCVERNWGIPPEEPEEPTPTSASAGPTSSAGNGVQTPTPTQQGMVADCDDFYFVQKDDGCADIAAAHGISLSDFYSWNPAAGPDCAGLWANVYVCVGIIGSNIPSSTFSTITTTTTTTPGNGISTPTPTQPGMVSNCNEFDFVEPGTGCADIALRNGISRTQFNAWNPSVGTDCAGLWANVYVCVGIIGSTPTPTSSSDASTTTPGNGITTPTPIRAGMTTDCDTFYFVRPGDGCVDIAIEHGISTAQFYEWNPAAGADCQGLWADTYVCVGVIGSTPVPTTTSTGNGVATPTPIQPGMTTRCNRFHEVVAGDTCETIATPLGISLSNFYSWNPGVGDNCETLWAEYFVCTRVF